MHRVFENRILVREKEVHASRRNGKSPPGRRKEQERGPSEGRFPPEGGRGRKIRAESEEILATINTESYASKGGKSTGGSNTGVKLNKEKRGTKGLGKNLTLGESTHLGKNSVKSLLKVKFERGKGGGYGARGTNSGRKGT